MTILHLNLGEQLGNPCDVSENDVLSASEHIKGNQSTHCFTNGESKLSTVSNRVAVNFFTNMQHDAQGFRIFFTAGEYFDYADKGINDAAISPCSLRNCFGFVVLLVVVVVVLYW